MRAAGWIGADPDVPPLGAHGRRAALATEPVAAMPVDHGPRIRQQASRRMVEKWTDGAKLGELSVDAMPGNGIIPLDLSGKEWDALQISQERHMLDHSFHRREGEPEGFHPLPTRDQMLGAPDQRDAACGVAPHLRKPFLAPPFDALALDAAGCEHVGRSIAFAHAHDALSARDDCRRSHDVGCAGCSTPYGPSSCHAGPISESDSVWPRRKHTRPIADASHALFRESLMISTTPR